MARPDPGVIAFGTMRMVSKGWPVPRWCDFFDALYEQGVRQLHVSSEYDSYPLVCEVLAARRERGGARFAIVMKMADPSFDDAGFDAARFADKLAGYREVLGEHTLDAVQWMWRAGLKDDNARLSAFAAQADVIGKAVAQAKADGGIGSFLCFPYTPAFALAALEQPFIDGLTVYRNLGEPEYDMACERAVAAGKSIMAIRPYGAGSLFEQGHDVPAMLEHVFASPAVNRVVVTATEADNLSTLIRYFNV